MEVFELQIGDWVNYLGDPVSVISLNFNDDESIGIISSLASIFMLREKVNIVSYFSFSVLSTR